MYTKGLRWLYIIFWPWGLLTFYDPYFLITSVSQKMRKDDTGETSLSRNWYISFFSRSAFMLFVIHKDKWKIQSHTGSAVLTLIETTLSFCIPSNIQSSQVIYIIFWPRGLLTFYDPFWWWLVNQKTYFLQRRFFLSQAPPSEGTR